MLLTFFGIGNIIKPYAYCQKRFNVLKNSKGERYTAREMTIAIVDGRISSVIEAELYRYAERIIKLPPFSRLAAPVASHPDMLIFAYGGVIFTWSEYRRETSEIFAELEKLGFEIREIAENASSEYPADVKLNCAVIGKRFIANKNAVSASVLAFAEEKNIEIIHTRQGYAKCSAVCISENAIITADPSVYNSAVRVGIDALKIDEGYVRLDGYNTGFIGGASGGVGDKILFCGMLGAHPSGEKIREFCRLHGKTAVSLSDEPLYDYGTVMFFVC